MNIRLACAITDSSQDCRGASHSCRSGNSSKSLDEDQLYFFLMQKPYYFYLLHSVIHSHSCYFSTILKITSMLSPMIDEAMFSVLAHTHYYLNDQIFRLDLTEIGHSSIGVYIYFHNYNVATILTVQ